MSKKTYTLSQFQDALSRMEKAARGKALQKSALAGGFVLEGQAKINAERVFHASTGNLSGSINTQVLEADDSHVVVGVGPSVVYGRIQELGGTVVPVSAKYLAIPVNAKKNSSPRDYPNLKLRMPRGSDPIFVDESGQVMFVLKKSVTLPARPYLRPAADENEEKIIEAVAKNLEIEIELAL